MEVVTSDPDATWRHPTQLEVAAGILLAVTVVLHVVAMFPAYFVTPGGHSALVSQADQAASYGILAAGWALVLGIGLTGPTRVPICAGLATGLAATEFGFRVSDVGAIIRYGSDLAGAGLWIMVAAWVVGAAAAVLLVTAALRRNRRSLGRPADPVYDEYPSAAEPVAAASSAGNADLQAGPYALESEADDTLAPAAATAVDQPEAGADPDRRWILWTGVLGVLGLVTAAFFLPAWDHYVGVASATGRTFSFNLGNAFSGPWQVVLGNVLVAAALVALPIVASLLRDRGAAAAMVGGGLIVLASQFVSAVVQVDEPVTLTAIPARYLELGSQFGIKLTAWFTIDVLAAFALFAAVLVWATSRVVYANSRGTLPDAPESRSEAMSSAS
jgi:hypothetical protein